MSIAFRLHVVVVHEKLDVSLDQVEGIYFAKLFCGKSSMNSRRWPKAYANINVTAAALAEPGVEFLVADTSLWRLVSNIAVTYAEKATKACGSSWKKWSYKSTMF